jgi:MFS family permease
MVSGVERRALVGVLGTTAAGVLPAFLVGGLGVQLRADLDIDAAALGAAAGIPFAAAALASIVLGRVAERFGPGRTLRVAALGSAATMLAIAALARSWATLAALLVLAGVVNAAAQPAANLYLARAVPPTRLGWALALKQSAIPAGTLLAGLAVPAIALTVGWEWAFVGGAVLASAAVLLLPGEPARTPSRPGDPPPARRALTVRVPTLVLLGCGSFFGAATTAAGAAFLVSGSADAGLDDAWAGLLLTFGSALSIGHRLWLGRRADRVGSGALRTVATLLALGSLGSLLFSFTTVPTYVLGVPLAFGVGWAWPGLFNLAVVRANPEAPGAATGVTQTGTYLGALSGPIVMGLLVDTWGYRTGWLVVAAAFLAGAGTVLLGRRRLRRERAAASSPEPVEDLAGPVVQAPG